MAQMKNKDQTLWGPADYGSKYGTISGYSLSAAWVWTSEEQLSCLIFYNDV